MKDFFHVLKNYAVFEGRSRRSEYWWFILIHTLIMVAITLLDFGLSESGEGSPYGTMAGVVYSFAVFLPALGVLIRRLHDSGKSGYWFFISFIPVLGSIILLVLLVQDSEAGTNRYGRNPKTG